MRPHAASWTRALLVLVMFAAPGILAGSPARAQVDPTWDHYKTYLVGDPVTLPQSVQVTLRDQFQETTWFVRQLGWSAPRF